MLRDPFQEEPPPRKTPYLAGLPWWEIIAAFVFLAIMVWL